MHPMPPVAPTACVAACLVVLSGPAGAQPVAGEGMAPQQVQITGQQASDTELRRREPVARTIYGREELDKYGDTNVSEVLKRLPGVNVQGGNPRLRGMGAGYTLILINGEPAPPGFSLDNLSPSQVERIEVTKGPTAEHSARAVAGTINIILRDAPRQRQRELRLGTSYAAVRPAGSFTATYGDRFDRLSLVLPLSGYTWRNASDSETDRDTRDVLGAPQRLVVRTHDEHWGGGLNFSPRLNWRLNPTDTLSWQSMVQHNRFNSRGRNQSEVLSGQAPISVDDRYRNEGTWQQLRSGLQLAQRWPEGERLDARIGLQASRARYRTPVEGSDALGVHTLDRLSTGENQEAGWSTSGKATRPLFESHTLAAGWDADVRRRREQRSVVENGQDQLLGYEGEAVRATVERVALYVQDEWSIDAQWSTYFGLRGERITTRGEGVEAEVRRSVSTVLTPVWHLNYKLDAKGRDLIRASLTRSYKAPELNALLARPSIVATYPVNTTNPQISPDRVGNPALEPELATGLDLAFEKYFNGGGLMSIGLFHRRINGLIRNVLSLETVPWASAPRWVSRPQNLQGARSTGLEFELKGRAGQLLGGLVDPALALDLRASLNLYRSSVKGIPGPDNRLESQQPYSLTLGFDHVAKGLPLTWGASLAYTPAYTVQQTVEQQARQGVGRTLDLYGVWNLSRAASLRLALNNLAPLDQINRTEVIEAPDATLSSNSRRSQRSSLNLALTLKF